MATQIARDPFARASLMRETVRDWSSGCTWCGSFAKGTRLFRYFWEDDSGIKPFGRPRKNELFCSVSCFRTYKS